MYTLYQRGLEQVHQALHKLLFPGGVKLKSKTAEEEKFYGKLHAISQFAAWFGQKKTSETTKISANNICENVLHFTQEINDFLQKPIQTIDRFEITGRSWASDDDADLKSLWGVDTTNGDVPVFFKDIVRKKFERELSNGSKKISKFGKNILKQRKYIKKFQYVIKYADPALVENDIEFHEELKDMVSSGCTQYQARCWLRRIEMSIELLKVVPYIFPFKVEERDEKLQNFRYLRDLGALLFEHGLALDALLKNVISEYD